MTQFPRVPFDVRIEQGRGTEDVGGEVERAF